jgi:hypothetical protein
MRQEKEEEKKRKKKAEELEKINEKMKKKGNQ